SGCLVAVDCWRASTRYVDFSCTLSQHTSCLLVPAQRSADPLYLRSFPARRSSDLALRRPSTGASSRSMRASCLARPRACRALTPDRKSTRLNSSHVKISYAVFCLKKKKIDRTTGCEILQEKIDIEQTIAHNIPSEP